MTTTTHIVAGAAIGSVIYSAGLSPVPEAQTIFLCVVLSNLPDLNMLWHRRMRTHHTSFTHYPLFWAIMTYLVWYFETAIVLKPNYFLTLLVGLSAFVHMVMDTFGSTLGVHWFYPISKREFSFTKLRKDVLDSSLVERFAAGLKSNVVLAEASVWVISLLLLTV